MEDMSFEQAIARLEEIAALLEKGEISLEESMLLFEEGNKLAEICGSKLKDAELKITKLNEVAL